MSESNPWIAQVARIYKESKRSADQGAGSGATRYAEQFNDILEKIQADYNDNEVIQSIDHVGESAESSRNPWSAFDDLNVIEEVVSKSGRVLDNLGYSLSEEEINREIDSPVHITKVVQNQNSEQQVNQSMTAEITVESTMEMISILRLNQESKDELKEVVQQFENEVSKEEPDESRLRKYIEAASNKSPDVAANLLMLALQSGINGVSPLL